MKPTRFNLGAPKALMPGPRELNHSHIELEVVEHRLSLLGHLGKRLSAP